MPPSPAKTPFGALVPYGEFPVAGLVDGLERYFENGVLPGSFLQAVLANDFIEASLRADSVNRHHFREIALWLKHNAPVGSTGSRQTLTTWAETRRAVWHKETPPCT